MFPNTTRVLSTSRMFKWGYITQKCAMYFLNLNGNLVLCRDRLWLYVIRFALIADSFGTSNFNGQDCQCSRGPRLSVHQSCGQVCSCSMVELFSFGNRCRFLFSLAVPQALPSFTHIILVNYTVVITHKYLSQHFELGRIPIHFIAMPAIFKPPLAGLKIGKKSGDDIWVKKDSHNSSTAREVSSTLATILLVTFVAVLSLIWILPLFSEWVSWSRSARSPHGCGHLGSIDSRPLGDVTKSV